jgi:hypothetical protein
VNSTLLALIRVLPELVGLFMAIWRYVAAAKDRELGAQGAALEAIQTATKSVEAASLIRAQAEADHAKHPSDESGFDTSFKRAD